MLSNIKNYFVRRWIVMRMAAQEFYFKQPFDIAEEYPVMKSVTALALIPVEATAIFAYARIFGSLRNCVLPIMLSLIVINIIIANLVINSVKEKPIIDEAMSDYMQMDYQHRKALYSFKNIFGIVFITTLFPWLICGIGCYIICLLFPR